MPGLVLGPLNVARRLVGEVRHTVVGVDFTRRLAIMHVKVKGLLHVELGLGVIEVGQGARIAGLANPDAHQRHAGEVGIGEAEAGSTDKQTPPQGTPPSRTHDS